VQEACVKSNTTPIKPERKSRVTSVELEKARADENQREEVMHLLNESELTEQKVIGTNNKHIVHTFSNSNLNTKKLILEKTLEVNSTNSENKFSNVELRRETPSLAENFDKRHLPSSSKCDRKSKMITQSECDQRISLKGAEIVSHKIKKEKTSKREEKTGNNVKKRAANKINSTFKIAIESSIFKKYGAIMICQW